MWTYLFYVLDAFISLRRATRAPDGGLLIAKKELRDFVFDEVWERTGRLLYQYEGDFWRDLDILEGLGVLHIHGEFITITPEQREQIAEAVRACRNYPLRGKIPSLNRHFAEIEEVIESVVSATAR